MPETSPVCTGVIPKSKGIYNKFIKTFDQGELWPFIFSSPSCNIIITCEKTFERNSVSCLVFTCTNLSVITLR